MQVNLNMIILIAQQRQGNAIFILSRILCEFDEKYDISVKLSKINQKWNKLKVIMANIRKLDDKDVFL